MIILKSIFCYSLHGDAELINNKTLKRANRIVTMNKTAIPLIIMLIILLTSLLIPACASEGQQTQIIGDYKIVFSTNPPLPIIGQPAQLSFEVTRVATSDQVSGLHGLVHIYGPGIHKILPAQESQSSTGKYLANYTFPIEGSYNLALQAAAGDKEIWAFFKVTLGEIQPYSAILGRLLLSLAIAASAILGIVSTFHLSGRTKVLLSMVILFLSLSFTLAAETQSTQSMVVVYVLDQNGNPVAKALVTISGPLTASDVTDGGYCIFRDVPAGTYSITASAQGHPSSAKEETIGAGQTFYVFIFLQS